MKPKSWDKLPKEHKEYLKNRAKALCYEDTIRCHNLAEETRINRKEMNKCVPLKKK